MKKAKDTSRPVRSDPTHVFDAPNLDEFNVIVEACIALQVPFETVLITYDGATGQYPRFRIFVYQSEADVQ